MAHIWRTNGWLPFAALALAQLAIKSAIGTRQWQYLHLHWCHCCLLTVSHHAKGVAAISVAVKANESIHTVIQDTTTGTKANAGEGRRSLQQVTRGKL